MVVSFEEPPDSLDKAQQEAQEGQPKRRRDAFESALKAECSREKDLDDLFRKAAKKQQGKDETSKADNPLDDRWR
ncbi:MAG: hypothetical protein H8E15_00235 [Planctomycetes bacterium]|nr:hypothetical protein [Planctomycetota bacterium]